MVFTFGTPLSYGVFQQPISDAFGIPLVVLSPVFSVMLFTFFIGSGLVGVFAARVPARAVLLASAGATALVAPSLYVTNSRLGLAVVFAVLGLALGTVYVLLASIIPRWFDDRKGAATGVIFVGNGLGLFLLPPIWQFSIARFGVRDGFFAIMSVTAMTFFLAGITCRRPRWTTRSETTLTGLLEWVSNLVGTRKFQLLFIGVGLSFAWYQLLAAYAVDLFASRGLTEAGASALFGLIGGVSIISRIGGGYAADLAGSRRAFLASLGFVAVGVVLLVAPPMSVLAVSVFLIGIGLGGCATLYIPLLMEVYTPEKDTAVIGIFNVSIGIGALAMPPLGAASIAYTGGYTVAISLTLVLALLGLWLITVGTSNH
ncbi:MFS transporter [Natrialbaceae archaeon A-arb3/5]